MVVIIVYILSIIIARWISLKYNEDNWESWWWFIPGINVIGTVYIMLEVLGFWLKTNEFIINLHRITRYYIKRFKKWWWTGR